jgi:hypothetical protein
MVELMNTNTPASGKDSAAQLVRRVRAAVTAFVKNRDDFPAVTLALARELWAARQEVGGDDSAFGAWLAAHRLTDKITPQDRAALVQLGQHAKVAAKVLRQTSSRSVRLIWEQEVRPVVEPWRAFTNAGEGRVATVHAEVTTRVLAVEVPYQYEEKVLTISTARQKEPDGEREVTEPQVEPDGDAEPSGTPNRKPDRSTLRFAKLLTDDLISITATLAQLAHLGTDGREAAINQLCATCSIVVIGDALDFVAELRGRLSASLESSPADEERTPTAKRLH